MKFRKIFTCYCRCQMMGPSQFVKILETLLIHKRPLFKSENKNRKFEMPIKIRIRRKIEIILNATEFLTNWKLFWFHQNHRKWVNFWKFWFLSNYPWNSWYKWFPEEEILIEHLIWNSLKIRQQNFWSIFIKFVEIRWKCRFSMFVCFYVQTKF